MFRDSENINTKTKNINIYVLPITYLCEYYSKDRHVDITCTYVYRYFAT